MASLIGICQKLEAPNDGIGKIRRLSVVLDSSVKEMEKDLAIEVVPVDATMDYRNILLRLQEQKALQDERRFRLSQVSQQRRQKRVNGDTAAVADEKDGGGSVLREEGKEEKKKSSEFCYKCNIRVNLEDITTYAICRACDQTVCRSKLCSDWDRTSGYWECLTCINNRDGQVRAGEWILDQLSRRFKSSADEENPSGVQNNAAASHRDVETQSERSFAESTYSISAEQKTKVREFLEEIISELVGGPLDEVPVTQLHSDTEYLPVWDHECPGVKHLKLKRLIQKIVSEAMRLPDLFNHSGVPPRPEEHMPFFDPKKYEQLVATAVLNKVIESYRNVDNAFVENSSGVHTGSEADHGSKSELGQFRMEEDLDEEEVDGSTDLNEYVLKHRVPLPDLSTMDSEDSATTDEMSSSRSTGTEGTWEENWLFKKKKLKAETSIAMLVPSPTEEVKALIGDQNADEVSDLSESEDVVDHENTYLDDDDDMIGLKELPSVLIQSKTLIGGKNELSSFDDHSSGGDSLVSNPDSGINVTDARNDALVDEEIFCRVEASPVEAINEIKIVPIAAPRKISREEVRGTVASSEEGEESEDEPENSFEDREQDYENEEFSDQLINMDSPTSESNRQEFPIMLPMHLEELKPEVVPGLSGPISPAILNDQWMFNCGKWVTTESYLSEVRGSPELIDFGQTVGECPSVELRSEPLEILNFLDELKPESIPMAPRCVGEEIEKSTPSSVVVVTDSETLIGNEDDQTLIVHLEELKPDSVPTIGDPSSPVTLNENWMFNCGTWTVAQVDYLNLVNGRPTASSEDYAKISLDTTYGRSDPIEAANYLDELKPDSLPVCLPSVAVEEEEQVKEPLPPVPPARQNRRSHVAQPPKGAKEGEIVNVNGVLWRDGIVIREMCCEPMDTPSPPSATAKSIVDEVKSERFDGDVTLAPQPEKKPEQESVEDVVKDNDELSTEIDSGWVFVESGWLNVKQDTQVVDSETIEPSSEPTMVIEKEKVSTAVGLREQFLDFLKPQANDCASPIDSTLDSISKPEKLPTLSNRPLESAKLDNGWEFENGYWYSNNSAGESLLDSSGRPSCSSSRPEFPSTGPVAEVETTNKQCPFESNDYLVELKPVSAPVASEPTTASTRICNVVVNCEEIQMPPPEVELLPADQFVCVMTYDVDSQQIVCGMPISKETYEREWEKPDDGDLTASAADTTSINHQGTVVVVADVQNPLPAETTPTILSTHSSVDCEVEVEVAAPERGIENQSAGEPFVNAGESIIAGSPQASPQDNIVESVKTDDVSLGKDSAETIERYSEGDSSIEVVGPWSMEEQLLSTDEAIITKTILSPVLEEAKEICTETESALKSAPIPAKRYKEPLFEHMLPSKAPIPVVKVSEQLISGASDSVQVDVAPNHNSSSVTNHRTNNNDNLNGNVEAPQDDSRTDDGNSLSAKIAAVIADNVLEEQPDGDCIETTTETTTTENENGDEDHIIPGSLAEREHLKWQNATADIPNNPYSPEALEKRLKSSTSSIGVSLAATTTTTSAPQSLEPGSITSTAYSENERDVGEEEVVPQLNGKESESNRTLKDVLGAGAADANDYKRYGRDYYINEAKRGCGTRKKANSPDLLASPRTEATPIFHSENDEGRVRIVGEDDELFLAKPIMVEADDPLLKQASKLDHLSTEHRDVYLLPLNEAETVEKKGDCFEEEEEDSSVNTSNPPASLSLSEDSDTTRIYDIQTMETRFEKPRQKTQVSPDTVKFFAPRTVPKFTKSVETKTVVEKSDKEIPSPISVDNATADLINRLVIEDDVLPVLPSVKKLASAFASKQTTDNGNLAAVKLTRTKIPEPVAVSPAEDEPAVAKIKSPSKDPAATAKYFNPGYSITGRSISKKFREELKHSTNTPDGNNNELECENRNGDGRVTPERSPSPVLVKGRLKNNIAFYENLTRE